MCRRSFESQDISTLAVRFTVWLICAVCCLPWGPNSLTEEHSLLSCSLCFCGVFCLSYKAWTDSQ